MHHPEGIDPEQIFFHEAQIRDLILSYQREPVLRPGGGCCSAYGVQSNEARALRF
jgi:hypothetical protein